jgi:hypothetical protein
MNFSAAIQESPPIYKMSVDAILRLMVKIQLRHGVPFFSWKMLYNLLQCSSSFYSMFRPCLYSTMISVFYDANNDNNNTIKKNATTSYVEPLIQLFSRLEKTGWNFQVNQSAGWIELAR